MVLEARCLDVLGTFGGVTELDYYFITKGASPPRYANIPLGAFEIQVWLLLTRGSRSYSCVSCLPSDVF